MGDSKTKSRQAAERVSHDILTETNGIFKALEIVRRSTTTAEAEKEIKHLLTFHKDLMQRVRELS